MNKLGEVKVGDFGLGRDTTHKGKPLTVKVMTMIYRAPEVLFGTPNYSSKVDIWSLGCVLVELLIGEPLFCTAKTPAHLIDQIFTRVGTPTEESWPGLKNFPYYEDLNPKKPPYEGNLSNFIFKKNPKIDKVTLEFASLLLTLNPEKRPSAAEALSNRYFFTEPLPCSKDEMPKIEKECHELEIRKLILQKKEREREAMLAQVNQAQQRRPPGNFSAIPGWGPSQPQGNSFNFVNYNQFRNN